MTRVRRGYIARRRRKRIRSFAAGFRGAHSRLTQTIAQQQLRAWVSSHRDRGRQKREFRRLWITRLNAAIREHTLNLNYSLFIHTLYKRQLLLNRKILAQLAIFNRNCLSIISTEILSNLPRISLSDSEFPSLNKNNKVYI
uniref:Large ribosomal subunit protein bL20c n=1 Tax=Pharnaceum aurantium TaxID=2518628 RepID=A0A411L991_9CARY|nr:ribosomal protein L20 [Pharnaceum aurantium]